MNILFLTPGYMYLYKPIEQELQRKGNNVCTIMDDDLPHTPYFRNKPWPKQFLKHIWLHISRLSKRYWEDKIKHYPFLLEKFDMFICINGCCLTKYLIDVLRKNNPNIKMVLYLWDTLNFYNYERNAKYFDKVLSFDYEEANIHHWEFLPFYWVPTAYQKTDNQYMVSIIGSNHDDRLKIVSKIAKQLDANDIKYYFGIFVGRDQFENEKFGNHVVLLRKIVSVQDTLNVMKASNCILDTDRATQTGTTPRMIWALAMGKKIITTNQNIVKLPFYDKRQIQIISRDNPIIDIDFCENTNEDFSDNKYIQSLRIDRWVGKLIDL